MIKCPLCGYEYNEDQIQSVCQGCPLHGKCSLVKCPNCGYEVPRQSRLLKALRMLRRKRDESE